MLLLPVGHEEDQYRRLPVVALAVMGLCVLVFAATHYLGYRVEIQARAQAELVLDFANENPDVVVDEEFLFTTTQLQLERSRQGDWWASDPDGEADPAVQARLDQLVEDWRTVFLSAPAYRFGLTPNRLEITDLVTHIFIHGGWLHLIGNLFFFWLVGPPLEDVWGRPLFAGFFLVTGVAAALLWAARYPDSAAPIIGASGAIAGLMGGFFIRFWGSKVRMFYILLIVLRIKTGFFQAPAWLLLGLWVAREIAFGSWLEPHSMPVGGVATWAHVFGFGSGAVLALAIKLLRVEERWVVPTIAVSTGDLENPAIETASKLRESGRIDEAWELLSTECRAGKGSSDAIGRWWDLAVELGRQDEVAPYFMRLIHRELSRRELELACSHWLELRDSRCRVSVPPSMAIALAEALVEWGGPEEESEALLLGARERLDAAAPVGTVIRMARASVRAKLPGSAAFCSAQAERVDLEAEVRSELRQLAAAANF